MFVVIVLSVPFLLRVHSETCACQFLYWRRRLYLPRLVLTVPGLGRFTYRGSIGGWSIAFSDVSRLLLSSDRSSRPAVARTLVDVTYWLCQTIPSGAYTMVLGSIPSRDTDFFFVWFSLPRWYSVTSPRSQLILLALSPFFTKFPETLLWSMAPIRLYNLASLADHAIGSPPIILRLLPPWYWAGRRAPLFTLSLSMFYVLFPFFTDQAKTCSLASGLLMHTQCHPHYSPFSMFFSYMQKFPPALSFQVSLFFFPFFI